MWKCVRLLALALAAAALAPGAAAQGAKFKYALGDVVSIDELPLLVAVERAGAEPGDRPPRLRHRRPQRRAHPGPRRAEGADTLHRPAHLQGARPVADPAPVTR